MSRRTTEARTISPAARVFANLQADDALLPSEASALRKTSAVFLALLVLAAVPLFWAANAAGLIGDVPAAVAKSGSSGPGGGAEDDDDDRAGSGGNGDDNDRTFLKTDDTSRPGHSTRGTTRDNDTRTNSNTHTRGQTQTRTRGQTQTRTRTGG